MFDYGRYPDMINSDNYKCLTLFIKVDLISIRLF